MAIISILIPAYNHQNYVEETLDSILHDSFKNKEIVIINDGSTDNTDKVITSWIEKHSKEINITYKSRENRGLTKTLNELLSLSNGSYLVAIASDDFLLDGGLQKRYEYLQNHPDKYAVFSDCIVVDNNSKKSHDSGLFEYRHANKANLLTDEGIKREMSSVNSSRYLRLLEDSKKTLLLHWNDFFGFNKLLLLKEIAKFTVRINLHKIKNR